jgi:glutathione peroxidase
MLKWILLAGAMLAVGAAALFLARVTASRVHTAQSAGEPVHGFTLRTATGAPAPTAAWAGQVVLLVNTASKCGYTKQYEGLEALQARHGARGFTVVAVPSNDFLGQEPGTDEQIQEFCRVRFSTTFPVMAKERVLGADAHPLFRRLQDQAPVPGRIPWNFTKYLIGRDGRVIARFDPRVDPGDPRVEAAITAALGG